jgi:hypothetical protein
MTPGLVAVGGGTKGAPLFGAGGVGAKKLMRWSWVRCLACNPPDDARKAGATYRHLNLSDAQIAQRAQMANMRAAYQPEVTDRLGKLAGNRSSVTPTARSDDGKLSELMEQNKQLNARLDELLKQNAETMKQNVEMTATLSRMSMQVAALLEDNAKLRATQPIVLGTTLLTLPAEKPA